MSCPHAGSCPLFPLLNASLACWRSHYCDTPSVWGDCARFQRAVDGLPVPVAMLPNGRVAQLVTVSSDECSEPPPRRAQPGVVTPPAHRRPARPSWGLRLRTWWRCSVRRLPAPPAAGDAGVERPLGGGVR